MGTSENNNYLNVNKNYELKKTSDTKGHIYTCYNLFWIFKALSDIKWKWILPPLLACVCYGNGLNGDFVHDDIMALKRNGDVTGLTSVFEVFFHDFWGRPIMLNSSHKSYRPITTLTFRLNYQLAGAQTFYFHVTNVFLHVVVTSLVMYTCLCVFRLKERCTFIAGLLFAVHPVHVEAVTGLVGRADVMAAVFFLLSLNLYIKAGVAAKRSHIRRTTFFIGSLFLASVAMLCKENGVTVLGVCIIYDSVQNIQTLFNRKIRNRGSIFAASRVAATVVFTLALMAARVTVMGNILPKFTYHDNPASFHSDTRTRLLTRGYIWSYNVWMLLTPISLCYDWQHGSIPLVESLGDIRNLATAMTAIGALLLVVRSSNFILKQNGGPWSTDSEGTFWSLALIVIPFLPASNILFTVGFVIAERVLYIPSIGFCVLVALGVCRIMDHWQQYQRLVSGLLLCLVMLHCWKTMAQNTIWNTRESLFRSGISAMPHNAKVHYNYGNFLKDTERTGEAITHYQEALRLDPTYASAHNNLGVLLEDRFMAEIHFQQALQLNPRHQGAHINIGTLLFKRGSREEGLQYLRKAVDLGNGNPEALMSLAWSLIQLQHYTEARTYLDRCLELNPDYMEAYLNYGNLLSALGEHEKSVQYFMKVHQLEPERTIGLTSAADAYKHLKDFSASETLLKQALSIKKDANILEQLAMLYYGAGRTEDSLTVFKDFDVLYNHNSSDAVVRYAKILAVEGYLEKAEAILSGVIAKFVNDVEYLVTIALVKSNLRKHSEAAELLSKAILLTTRQNTRDLEKMFYDRGSNYQDNMEYDKALNDYLETIHINPNHAQAQGNIGVIYHLQGNLDKARHHYRRALKADPKNSIVLENLRKLDRVQTQSSDRG